MDRYAQKENKGLYLHLLLLVVGPQSPDSLSGPPDFLGINLLSLLLEVLPISRSRVEFERSSRLGTVLYGSVQLLKDGLDSLVELGPPVEGSPSSSGGASVVHVVHTVLADQGVKGLCGFLDGLVEGFRRGVTVGSENLVLSDKHSLDTSHEGTSFTVKVRVDLLFKGGLVNVSGSDSNSESDGLFLGLAGNVLEDSDRGVDSSTLKEEGSDSSTGSLGSDENDIDIGRRDDTSLVTRCRFVSPCIAGTKTTDRASNSRLP